VHEETADLGSKASPFVVINAVTRLWGKGKAKEAFSPNSAAAGADFGVPLHC